MKDKKIMFAIGSLILVLMLSAAYFLGTQKNNWNRNSTAEMYQKCKGTKCGYVPMEHGMDMTSQMHDMTMSLENKTGEEFDKTFISEMIIHHQGAVDMAKMALENASHKEIKDLAKAIIEAQEKEIKQMKDWQKNWGY